MLRTTGTSNSNYLVVSLVMLSLLIPTQARADSSSHRLAAYYDEFLALCGGQVFEWRDDDEPKKSTSDVKQVGVGKNNRYALTQDGVLIAWGKNPRNPSTVMDGVISFHAGRSGLLVIKEDNNLWSIDAEGVFGFGESLSDERVKIANDVVFASVGDSANYYVTKSGSLFVHGLAHRGQYGDGKLTATEGFIETAQNVVQVVSHTGHALILKGNGDVYGTGGNIFGPLGRHGYGDKADRWGIVFDGATSLATGSSHTVAIRKDNSLWIWGRNEGLTPKKVMEDVVAVAAGNHSTIALSKGWLWQWNTGSRPDQVMKCE